MANMRSYPFVGFGIIKVCLGLRLSLRTGRHHQIRVQFAYRGHPVIGDFRYGSKIKFGQRALALHARSLTISHPTRKEEMTFVAGLEPFWPIQFRTL